MNTFIFCARNSFIMSVASRGEAQPSKHISSLVWMNSTAPQRSPLQVATFPFVYLLICQFGGFQIESYMDFQKYSNHFDFKLIIVIKRFFHNHWPKSGVAFIMVNNCSRRSQANAFPAHSLFFSPNNSCCIFIRFINPQ